MVVQYTFMEGILDFLVRILKLKYLYIIIGDIKSKEDISHGWYLIYQHSKPILIVNLQRLFLKWSIILPLLTSCATCSVI